MAHTDKHSAVGLDIGTSRIVSATMVEDVFEFKSELNSFITLPMSKMTEQVLKRENVPHAVVGQNILVHGNESERFADLLQMDTRRPMTRGTLNASEPEGVNIIRAIVQSLVGPATHKGQKLCFSVPAAPIGGNENLTYHEATIKRMPVDETLSAKVVETSKKANPQRITGKSTLATINVVRLRSLRKPALRSFSRVASISNMLLSLRRCTICA